jgi:hypothetical protein
MVEAYPFFSLQSEEPPAAHDRRAETAALDDGIEICVLCCNG